MDLSMRTFFQLLIGAGSIVIALSFVLIRISGTKRPVTPKKIIIPPLGMSTGFFMFLYAPMRIPWDWAVAAFLIGAVFLSVPLIKTTKLVEVNGEIFAKRSKSFIFILIGLFILRISLHSYIEQYISIEQTGSIFFILAYGMILPWRAVMLRQYLHMPKRYALMKQYH